MDRDKTELKTKVDNAMKKNGELDRLKGILRTRLLESGWREDIKLSCYKIIEEHGVHKIDLDTLVSEVTPVARSKVPDSVKKELLQLINVAVRQQLESDRPSMPTTTTGIGQQRFR